MCPPMPVTPVLWKLRQSDCLGHGVRLQWDHFSVKLRNKAKQQQQQQQNQENQIGARDEGNDTFRELREGNCPPRVLSQSTCFFRRPMWWHKLIPALRGRRRITVWVHLGTGREDLSLKNKLKPQTIFNKYKLIFYQEALTKGISKSHTAGRQTGSEDANMRLVDKTEAPLTCEVCVLRPPVDAWSHESTCLCAYYVCVPCNIYGW